MEHKHHIFSFVFFMMMLCALDFVIPSKITIEKSLTDKTYTNAHVRRTMRSNKVEATSFRKRRYFHEKDHVGQADSNVEDDLCGENDDPFNAYGSTLVDPYDIIRPTWMIAKQGKGPCPKLVVWVPKKTGFTEFVKVNQQSKVEGGFSIAIFCYALRQLPFKVQPIFKPFINDKRESNGTYDQLVQHIKGKTCEAIAGDVTIRASRTQYVDFTIPYMSSDVYMLVNVVHEWNQNLCTFLRPFTWRLWITIVGVCIYIGVAVAILEYRVGNPKFTSPMHKKIIMVIWFPISTFFFHEGKILNRNSKVVLVMWLSMIFIVVQIFTATLSSWLTLDQLCPKLPSSFENAGYPDGSFLKDFIIHKYKSSGKNLIPLKTVEEYKNALSNGSVNVIFHELPYIELFLTKYGSDYMKFGPINQEFGIAFAFPHRSPLLGIFSRALINVTESDIMMEMKKKYLGYHTQEDSQHNQSLPQSLDVQSFIGLFVFIGTLTMAVIISSEVSIKRAKHKVLPISNG